MSLVEVCIVLCGVICTAQSRPSCSYQCPTFDEVVLSVPLSGGDGDSSRTKRVVFQSLRVRTVLDASVLQLTTAAQHFLNASLLPEAVGFWERALSVRRSSAPIRLSRKCASGQYYLRGGGRPSCSGECADVTLCGETLVPPSHLFVSAPVDSPPGERRVEQCHFCTDADERSCLATGPSDGAGVTDADFVLYVSAVASPRCTASDDTIAYAAHCQQEAASDRPIAGHVNICPDAVSTAPHDQEVLQSTVKHEILHALGFSAGLFAFFRDQWGRPRTPRNEHGRPLVQNLEKGYYQWSESTIKSVSRLDWWTRLGTVNHTVQIMVTERVRDFVREHFKCDRLSGAEMENQGSSGSELTHWEKRVFENEAMTATHTQNPVYSALTFALLEDSGWYRADYTFAQSLHWGRNLGCEFAMNSCGAWIAGRKRQGLGPQPFCDSVKRVGPDSTTKTTCSDSRDSLALCNLVQFDRSLPLEYQNFASLPGVASSLMGHYGGAVEFADFCPYNQEFEWKNGPSVSETGERRDSRCDLPSNTPVAEHNAALESYADGARCFEHGGDAWTLRKCGRVRTFQQQGAGCYDYRCVGGRLFVVLFNETAVYPCYRAGQEIRVRRVVGGWLHEGSIVCPACRDLCQGASFVCDAERAPPRSVDDPVVAEPCAASRLSSLSLAAAAAIILSFLVGPHAL